MRNGRLARLAILLVVGMLGGPAVPAAEAGSLRKLVTGRGGGKERTDKAAASRRTARPRRTLGGLSLSRKGKQTEVAAAVEAAPEQARTRAPKTTGKKTNGIVKTNGLVARTRATWAKVPRVAKIGIAGLVVGAALAGSWALPVAIGVKLAVMGGVVALSGVGGLYARARGKNAGWKKSPSYAAIDVIEQAASRGDATGLDQLEGDQRTRQTSLASAIASARRMKSDRLPDGTKVEDAQREHDFIGLAVARATLHETIHSADASRRVGQRTVESWTQGLGELDTAAQHGEFEGHLALELDALDAELAGEGRAVDGLSETIDAFGKHVPRLFGGEMKGARDATRALLEKFTTDEIGRERSLHQRTTGAMRGRVTVRLVARDRTFASRHARRERITALEAETGEVAALAEDIDSELESAISHRQSEQTYLAIAASKTAVPVTKTRTGSNGQPETYTDIEDQSGTYRALAWSEAEAAASAGRRANDGLARLRPMVEQLRANQTLRAEELDGELPAPNTSSVHSGSGPLMALVGPPLLRLLLGDGSNVRQVRSGFAPELTALRRVHGETSGRRQKEHTWVEGKVTEDVDQQKAEARKR